MPDILPQYQSFYDKYPDLFGWLKITDTEIDVPVMQSDDEERGEKYYYLHRDYTGKQSAEGSLFVDSGSNCYPQDQNTVIYGHNMSNGHIFGTLERFVNYDFFKYDTNDDFKECLEFIKENQLFDTGDELQYGDQILMLSTCEYSQENGRLVIVAKKVGV